MGKIKATDFLLEPSYWKEWAWQIEDSGRISKCMKGIHFHHYSHCLPLFLRFSRSQFDIASKKRPSRAFLVALWIRICLPMQETQVRSLIREEPTCHRAIRAEHHHCWAWALESRSRDYWGHELQILRPMRPPASALQQEKPPQQEACTPKPESGSCSQLEKKPVKQQRPSTAKNK